MESLFSSPPCDPFPIFANWFSAAQKKELSDPNAMVLATTTLDQRPHARVVLLKHWDNDGFVFFTNATSGKGQDIADNPFACLCFHWKTWNRQVRIEGKVTLVSAQESDRYFASRPRLSQIGAWASQQSHPLENRAVFDQRVAEVEARYANMPVPRPPHWGGYRVHPDSIEFWQGRPNRLHDRILYKKAGNHWEHGLLFP